MGRGGGRDSDFILCNNALNPQRIVFNTSPKETSNDMWRRRCSHRAVGFLSQGESDLWGKRGRGC